MVAITFLVVLFLSGSWKRRSPRQQLVIQLAIAALWAGGIRYALAVAVPYIPGTADTRAGAVMRIFSGQSRMRTCNEYVIVRVEDETTNAICNDRGILSHTRLIAAPLRVGDRVNVTVSRNMLGKAVTIPWKALNWRMWI